MPETTSEMENILQELVEKSGEPTPPSPESDVAALITEKLAGEQKKLVTAEQQVYQEVQKAGVALLSPTDLYPQQTGALRNQVGGLMLSEGMLNLTQYHDATAGTYAKAWFEELRSDILVPGVQAVEAILRERVPTIQNNTLDIVGILQSATTQGVYDHSLVAPALLPVLTRLRVDSPEDFPLEATQLHDAVTRLVETVGACHVWTPMAPPPDNVMANIRNIYERPYDAASTVFAIPKQRLPQRGVALLEPTLVAPISTPGV